MSKLKIAYSLWGALAGYTTNIMYQKFGLFASAVYFSGSVIIIAVVLSWFEIMGSRGVRK